MAEGEAGAPILKERPPVKLKDIDSRIAVLSHKKRGLISNDNTSVEVLAKELDLEELVKHPESQFSSLGIDIQRLPTRKKADATTILAAAEIGKETEGQDTVASALLLSTNYSSQQEQRTVIEAARKGDKRGGVDADIAFINKIAGMGLANIAQISEAQRLLSVCIAQVSTKHGLSTSEVSQLARHFVGKNPVGSVDQRLIEEVSTLQTVSRKVFVNQSRTGIPSENISFSTFTQIGSQLLEKVAHIQSSAGLKRELANIIEAHIPASIASLEEVTRIVQNNPEILGVSFDMYDTLVQWSSDEVERRGHFAKRTHKVLQSMGIVVDKDLYDGILNKAWAKRWDEFQIHGNELELGETINQMFADIPATASLDTSKLAKVKDKFIKTWYRVELETASVMPGAKATLDELQRRGIKICLTSNASWSRDHIEKVLRRFGLLEYFDAVSISSEGSKKMKKPQLADFFHESWAKLGLDPSQVLHVGDNPYDDVQGAQYAGGKAVQYDNPTAFRRLSERHIQQDPALYAQAAYEMEQQALDQDFPSWLRLRMKKEKIPLVEQKRVEQLAQTIYSRSREVYAPVYIALARSLLGKLQAGEAEQVLCLARDGLPLAVTTKLLRQFQSDKYDRVTAQQIKYIHASRKILDRVVNPVTPEDHELRGSYLQYLNGKGVLGVGKKTILTDLLCGSGKTHLLMTSLLSGQTVTGEYLDNNQEGRLANVHGFFQSVIATDRPILTVGTEDGALLFFEALMNGAKDSVDTFEKVKGPKGAEIRAKMKRKEFSENVLVRGLSRESILLMNLVATKGLIDAVRLHCRADLVGMKVEDSRSSVQRLINHLAEAEADDSRLSIPWEEDGKWLLPQDNPLEMIGKN